MWVRLHSYLPKGFVREPFSVLGVITNGGATAVVSSCMFQPVLLLLFSFFGCVHP
jgi:hypothetical protein